MRVSNPCYIVRIIYGVTYSYYVCGYNILLIVLPEDKVNLQERKTILIETAANFSSGIHKKLCMYIYK